MESSELGPLWRRSLKSSKSIPLRSIDGSNPTIAPGASQSYCARNRADSGKSRLSSKVDTIIEDAIKKIYLTAEQPHISAVIEEVNLQCFKAGLKKPAAYTVRRRIATLSDRLKLEKRLREAGHARADEVLIFQAIEEMRRLEQESEHKTKKARRAREMRHQAPRHSSMTPAQPGPTEPNPGAAWSQSRLARVFPGSPVAMECR